MFDFNTVKHELNQYWYSENTVSHMLDEVTHHATRCAFLSTPSLYFALKNRAAATESHGTTDGVSKETATDATSDTTDTKLQKLCERSRLFEKDNQWCKDSHVVSYDFHYPERIPVQYIGAFDYVVADPPFITEDVWRRYIASVKLLLADGGKVLFTTVLENHTALEGLMDGPLFIARFRPYVVRLTYQYVCFCNYEPTKLDVPNAEVESQACDESGLRVLLAIETANELRRSEKTFAAQLHQRNRAGEVPLPSPCHTSTHAHHASTHGKVSDKTDGSHVAVDWNSLPLHAMPWGHIPDHLREYTNEPNHTHSKLPATSQSITHGECHQVQADADHGNDTAAAEAAPQPAVDFGASYVMLLRLREQLNEFKNGIDALQRLMDRQMRLRHQRIKLSKKMHAVTESASAAIAATTATAADGADTLCVGHQAHAPRSADHNGDEKKAVDDEVGRNDTAYNTVKSTMNDGNRACKDNGRHAEQNDQEAKGISMELEVLDAQIAVCEAERTASIVHMAKMADEITSAEYELHRRASTAALRDDSSSCAECGHGDVAHRSDGRVDNEDGGVHIPYLASMRDCIEAYRRVEVKKAPLQELAADATRKFKSPLFTRMKELLQEMKRLKANCQ